MTKRSANMVAAAGLISVVVAGVVYAAVGFASGFSCDAGSNCFFPSFFSPARPAADTETPSSGTLTSVALPPAQQGPAAPTADRRVSAGPGVSSPEPTATPSEPPNGASAAVAAQLAAMVPAPPPPAASEDAAPPVAEEAPTPDAAPSVAAPSATPPAPAVPAGPTEPEPGVLTDPPAGVVLDENTTSGSPPSTNAPPLPNVYVPVIIIPPVSAGRTR
jgi:hypothetical protein